MEWKKQIPNNDGYWLRVNAGHRVQLHQVFDLDGLRIVWGWGGQEKVMLIENIKDRLEHYYWYGPLPVPPKKAL